MEQAGSHRILGRLKVALTAVLVLVSVGAIFAQERPQIDDPSKGMKTPREAAEAIKRQADLIHAQGPFASPGATPRMKKRHGVFFLVSWSIPDTELKSYMRDAFRLGATVCFRGMIDDDFKKTVERTKTLAIELGKEAPHTAIDPIIFRQLEVKTVPALAIVNEQEGMIVEGAASPGHLLSLMVREQPELRELAEWYEGTQRSWERGGPIETPRPSMPKLIGVRHVSSHLRRYPIQERDMEALIRERLKKADWAKIRREVEVKLQDKLKNGPDIPLPNASAARAFTVDLTVQFDHDLKAQEGGPVLVKAGTQFNPLSVMTIRHRYVVIDGRNPAQVAFAKQQVQQYGSVWVKVMLTAGDFNAVSKELQDRVYWLMPELVTRFKLEHVPSVVTQNGPLMKVEEFPL